MATKRIARTVSKVEDINFLLNMTEDDGCSLSFIMEAFGDFEGTPRFYPYDLFLVPADSYGPDGKRNKKPFMTTVGRWIFNKTFIEKDLFDVIGYVNKPVDKGVFEDINKKLSYSVMEDKIPIDALKRYILKTQKYQPYCNIISPSITVDCMKIPSKIKKLKEELFKKYEKELAANDPVIAQKIEKELLDECKKILKDDEFMDLIRSGSRIKWGNNFKNMFVFRGATKEFDPTKPQYSIIKSNYTDGISQEDYATFANSVIMGPYSRAKKTEVGGYWEKVLVRALQHLTMYEEGSDCGTTRTIEVELTKKNIKEWMYSYVVDGGKLVELTSDTADKYIGKKVKMRFAMMCESPKGICNKCAGNLFTRIGVKEVGIAAYEMFSVIKNISMKAFHDSTVNITDVEKDYGLDKIFGFK